MIQDNSATKGSDATHQMSQSEYALLQNLTVLYGEGGANYLAKRMMAIMGDHTTRGARTRNHICCGSYAHLLYTVCEMNLACRYALRQFATQYLQNSISTIHILGFRLRPRRFAVIDYQTVRRDLGDWSDINALSADFDLMFDLV